MLCQSGGAYLVFLSWLGHPDVLNHPSCLVPEDEKILNADDLEEK